MAKKEKSFAVFGLGTFGYEVCKVLAEKGANVIAVDENPKLIERVKTTATKAVLIDSTDEESLKSAPLSDVDVAIVAIGDDMEASILTTAILKNIGVPMIISRAISDLHARVLKQVGATEILFIEIEQGKNLANRLLSPDVLDRIPISQNQTLAEVMTPDAFVGKSMQKLDILRRFNLNVVSIKRIRTEIDSMGNPRREEIVIQPSPTAVLEKEDVLVIIGRNEDIDGLKEV
jgi:trk system potassium uptake protein TrkA